MTTYLKHFSFPLPAVINACACPALDLEKEESFRIAQLTFDEICYNQQYGAPNFLTFAAFLRVCATTLNPGTGRDEVVRNIFSQAKNSGQVSVAVVEKLKAAASEALYEELINPNFEESDGSWNFPRSWTRFVKGEQTSQGNIQVRDRRSRPEAARLHEVRLLSGAAGRFSRGNDKDSISFEQNSF